MEEVWKGIKNYEGLYEISNYGRIKSLCTYGKGKNTTYIAEYIGGDGYAYTSLAKNGESKTFSLHRLVWDAFGDKPRNSRVLQVDHIDNNKCNNHINNLQLLSNRDNVLKSFKCKYYTGVYKNNTKYSAKINKEYLGCFDTPELASLAYQKRAKELYGN